jgi:hypothetical protein
MKRNPIELSDRLALTVEEAAAAIGVSKRHLHSKLSEVPHFYLGNRVVIPLKPFEEWLRDRATERERRRRTRSLARSSGALPRATDDWA